MIDLGSGPPLLQQMKAKPPIICVSLIIPDLGYEDQYDPERRSKTLLWTEISGLTS